MVKAGKRIKTEPILELDDPYLTARRGNTLRAKKFLRRGYTDWYTQVRQQVGELSGIKLEVGSGAGFMEEAVDNLIKSDILSVPRIHLVLDSAACPFANNCLAAVLMINVLHHIPRATDFFSEAARVLHNGGLMVMIEPWMTGWSRQVYTRLHHEPVDLDAPDWHFASSGPLSGANQALPWIIFQRDREEFERKFPMFEIRSIRPMMPLSYLLSGGFATRWGAPGWTYPLVRRLERILEKAGEQTAMFALIVLRKTK